MEKRLTVHTGCCGTPHISRTSRLSIDQNLTTDTTRTISDGLVHKSQTLSQMPGTQFYLQTFICFKIDLKVVPGWSHIPRSAQLRLLIQVTGEVR